jgi:hypothetical protein
MKTSGKKLKPWDDNASRSWEVYSFGGQSKSDHFQAVALSLESLHY